MREARGPQWTDWLHEHGVVALTGVDTRSLVLHLRERGAMRAAVVSEARDTDEVLAAVRAQPAMAGSALVAGVSTERAVHVRRRRRGARRGRRLRLQALDPAPARGERRSRRRLPARRRRRHDRRLRRRAALTGPGRSVAARGGDERGARAARQDAGARCLPRPPAARARDGPRDVQAAVRPPRREPPGARPPDEPRARDRPEPRLRRRDGRRRERHAHVALRRHRRRPRLSRSCARARRSSIPRRRRARTTPRRSSPAGSTS